MPSRSTERNFADFGEVVIIYNILLRRIIPIPTKGKASRMTKIHTKKVRVVPEKSIGIGIAQNYGYRHTLAQTD